MTDFLEQKRKEIVARMKELEPAITEYQRLEAAAVALGGSHAGTSRTNRRSGRPQSRSTQRGRPRGSGTRAKEALTLIKRRPGITVSELAREMKIQQNYLYRVMPGLAEQGLIQKDGGGWHPAKEK